MCVHHLQFFDHVLLQLRLLLNGQIAQVKHLHRTVLSLVSPSVHCGEGAAAEFFILVDRELRVVNRHRAEGLLELRLIRFFRRSFFVFLEQGVDFPTHLLDLEESSGR
jgi:hypothetical protein